MTIEFNAFPKITRVENTTAIFTEKIDGTNASLYIEQDGTFLVASRKRWITPEDDNFGFARWAYDHKDELIEGLGPGHHFGEWWGSGIQRGYGKQNGERHFSLFNTSRWDEYSTPECCDVVPLLGSYSFDQINEAVKWHTDDLYIHGSKLDSRTPAEGFMIYLTGVDVFIKNPFKPGRKGNV